MIEHVRDKFGDSLDVLFNNVGTNLRKATIDYALEEYRGIMQTNLESAYTMSQLCYPLLKNAESSKACVVFNSSVAGLVGIKSGSVYAATKGLIEAWECG